MGWLDFWKSKPQEPARHDRGKQVRQLRESLDSWEMFDFLRDRYYGNGQWYFPIGGMPAVGGTTNKIQGRNQYVFYTEQDLRFQRDAARILYASEPVAKAIEGNLNAFVIGKGMKYKLVLKKGMEGKATEEQLQEYQQYLDAWMDEQQWPEREQECFTSLFVDGEFFLRRAKVGGKIRYVRIEPEHIQNPQGVTFEDGWWLGVKYDKKDYETPVAYGYKLYGSEWEEIPADEMIHFKPTVTRNVARGVSMMYPILDDLDSIAKLSDNMRAGATAQAEIAYMISVTGATPNAITGYRDEEAEVSITNPVTGHTDKSRSSKPGSVKCHGDNVQFTTLPQGASVGYIAVYQNAMRIVASAFCMPEYMLTSDASNANYSSTLVAGTPFYRYVETLQNKLKRPFKQCMMAVLDSLYVDTLVPTELRKALDIDVTCDSPVVVDPYQDAQRREIEARNNVLAPQRWMMELGRDPQMEQQWIDEWRDANMEAVQAQQGIFPPDQQPADKPKVKEAWDESKHPRVASGEHGGEFTRNKVAEKPKEGQNDPQREEKRSMGNGIESYKFTPLSIFSGSSNTLEYYKDSWNNRKGYRDAIFNVGRTDKDGVTYSMPYDSRMSRITESYLDPLDDDDPEKALLISLAESGEAEEYTFRSIHGEFGGEGGQGHALTGSGHAKEVINKATGLFLAYLDRFSPDYVYYTAQGESRASLYEYMSKKIGKYAKYTPYKIDGKGYDGLFVVVKSEKTGEFESILADHGTTHTRLNQSKE